jgi:hypothetical protein
MGLPTVGLSKSGEYIPGFPVYVNQMNVRQKSQDID